MSIAGTGLAGGTLLSADSSVNTVNAVGEMIPPTEFAVFLQQVGEVTAPTEFAVFSQGVGEIVAGAEFAVFAQYVGWVRQPTEFAVVSQEVVYMEYIDPTEFAVFQQAVQANIAPTEFAVFRQRVRAETPAVANNLTEVYLDGVDISDKVSLAIRISAAEGQNMTADFTLLPDIGPIDIPGLQGREVVIKREIGGTVKTLFTGVIERPRYNYSNRSISCECADLREEKLAKLDHDYLLQLTGGTYSDVTQREDATGIDWVRELMKTVSGTLNYDGRGVLFFAPWGTAGTSDYTLVNNNVGEPDLSITFAERSRVVNSTTINVDYRYYRERVRGYNLSADTGFSSIQQMPAGTTLVRREAYYNAMNNINNWQLISISFRDFPNLGTGMYAGSRNIVNEIYALGATGKVARNISQPITESYTITVTAPESIDQYGEVAGSDQQYAVETDVDPDDFEETTPTAYPPSGGFSSSAAKDYIRYNDDNRSELNSTLTAAWKIAYKEILESHRKNYIDYTHRSQNGDVLDVRIGQTVTLSTDVVDAVGQITSYDHVFDDGVNETQIRLAVSYVSSGVSTTTNWAIPSQPSIPEQSRATPPTINGTISDGVVEFEIPEVHEVYVDEVTAEKTAAVTVKIPVDTLTLSNTA